MPAGLPIAADVVVVDASGFSGNLSASDTDVQTALDTLDALPPPDAADVSYTPSGVYYAVATDQVAEALDEAMQRAGGFGDTGGARVLTFQDSGKTFFLGGATGGFDLPTVSAGVRFRFVVDGALAGDVTITTDSGDQVIGYVHDLQTDAPINAGGNDVITVDSGTTVSGDWFEIESNGDVWIIRGMETVTAAVTFS